MRVTMVGHSTVLLEGAGTRLLTDPWFGTSGNLAYARLRPPGFCREDLRAIDGVLLSHGHWDHTDRRFLRSLDRSIPVLGPAGSIAIRWLKGARNFCAMRPWESRALGAATVTAVPALHLARTIGFVIELGDFCAYFAGDTYHRPFMAEIGRRFRLDVALLPVATFRLPMTMGNRGAVAAVADLGAASVIPIHLGIAPRSPLLRTHQTVESFARRLRDAGVSGRVVHLREGKSWEAATRAPLAPTVPVRQMTPASRPPRRFATPAADAEATQKLDAPVKAAPRSCFTDG